MIAPIPPRPSRRSTASRRDPGSSPAPWPHAAALDASPQARLSRRSLLLGGAAATGLLLAGCSSSSDDGADELGLSPAEDTLVLVGAFPKSDYLVSTVPQRLVFALAEPAGLLVNDNIPETLSIDVVRLDEAGERTVVEEGIEVARSGPEAPQAYYPLRTTFEETGTYLAVSEGPDGQEMSAAFEVAGPAAVALIQPGTQMPAVTTPTPDDLTVDVLLTSDDAPPEPAEREIAALCTRDPECPLHTVSFADSVAAGRPTALLVSTPEFCQTAVCGPVLEMFIPQRDAFPGIELIHCEVYWDDKGPTGGNLMPAVQQLGMTFEPALFLVGADGTLVDRLDLTFDRAELVAGLESIAPSS